jgi:multidrug resistance efflux pump
MSTLSQEGGRGSEASQADDPLKRAEHDLQIADRDLVKAEVEVEEAKAEVREAQAEIEEAERRRKEIEVKVDDVVKIVPRGTYVVSAFKALVGVSADRELDFVHHGVFEPLTVFRRAILTP